MDTVNFLVINCGTSSIKISLFRREKESLRDLLEIHLQEIFSGHPILEVKGKKRACKRIATYEEGISQMINLFDEEKISFSQLEGIGHRVVHGGGKYTKSVIITQEVERDIEKFSILAPLHNPPALEGIRAAKKHFPEVLHMAVFDTAFHVTLPSKAAYYAIPWALSKKHHIRRYGFHGIAHAFLWKRYFEEYGQEKKHHRAITLHLGSGCSITAIQDGISKETSMGFTPLDGIMMMTRSGELDPTIVAYLAEQEKKSPHEIITLLNHQSGILGVSQLSSSMEEIIQKAPFHPQAALALEMFIHHVVMKVGAYIAVLGGIDVLICSGGVGEHAVSIRTRVLESLAWCHLQWDEEKNHAMTQLELGQIACISAPSSKVKVCLVGVDENRCIAEELSLFKKMALHKDRRAS